MIARLSYANLIAEDIAGLSRFYQSVFNFPEIIAHRSPIYICLDAGSVELGFNAPMAYELLGIANRKKNQDMPDAVKGVSVYLTFEVAQECEIDFYAERAVKEGGAIIKAPYDTYYNARQCVLADPEGNIFRLNFRRGERTPADQVVSPPWG